VATEDGWSLGTHAIPNTANITGPYPAFDLAGTWMIGFQRDFAPDKLDATSAMVLNIDVDGENVPSTLTITGREYDLIRKEKALPMQLSLRHCRPLSLGEPWRCPPSLGKTGCSQVRECACCSANRRDF
jgi:hypothetical protein